MSDEVKDNDRRDGKSEDKIYQARQSQFTNLVSAINKTFKEKINELKNFLIVGAIIFGIVLYFIYEMNKQTKAEITVMNNKIDIVLGQNTYMSKNMNALSGTICYNCHNNTKMFLPKTTLKLDEFIGYVRGNRFVTNSVMPVFTEKDVSYKKLQDIWKALY